MTKFCKFCNTEKPLIEFSVAQTCSQGRSNKCKSCYSAWQKEHYRKNKEVISKKQATYYQANKEKIKKRCNDYYHDNTAAVLETCRKYRELPAVKKKNAARAKTRSESPSYRDAQNEYKRRYYVDNKEYMNATGKKWRADPKNKEKQNRTALEWSRGNPEKRKTSTKKWRDNNQGKVLAATIKRRSDKDNRTPPWFEKEEVSELYKLAAGIRKTGIAVHVDHVIPLRGELVSGLHCLANLQIMTAKGNMEKGNAFEIE